MKQYFLDTNIILRFLLKDVSVQAKKAKEYFYQAKKEKIKLILIAEVVLEAVYVLEKSYHVPRVKISELLSSLIKSKYLETEKKEILIAVLQRFWQTKLDFVDLLLLEQSRSVGK
ncbi:PIN domain-containing protein [Microgenomates group bacterium]|nr:PIN domain-containing protein [Microgenomates group bacterium]